LALNSWVFGLRTVIVTIGIWQLWIR
jgi:hypothetical protein